MKLRAELGARSPLALGLGAGVGLAALSLALTLSFGWAPGHPLEARFWLDPRGWFDCVLSGLFGWAIGAAEALMRGARRDLEALRPVLGSAAPGPTALAIRRRSLRGAALTGVALGVGLNLLPANWPGGMPGLRDPFFVWAVARSCLVAWSICRVGVVAATLSSRFSRLGPSIQPDDLLHVRALAPLGREGLRNVAVWVGISAFFALMLMAPFGRAVTLASMTVSAAIGIVAFVGPVRGARRRLIELRDAELARIRSALAARVGGKPAPDGRWLDWSLADLLAFEARIERVRTWPFDASTLARLALYAAIGLCSWVGAALVERALGAALG